MASHASVLAGSVTLVTGGGTGIGRAVAIRLAAEGAAVIVTGRREQFLDETVASIKNAGGHAHAVRADLALVPDLYRLANEAKTAFGPIDHLINNAVMNYGGPFDTVSVDQIRHMLAVGFEAPLLLTRLFLPDMVTRHRGSIVMIGSTALVGWPEVATYSGIKAGLDGFAQALRREVAADGVHVAAVHPAGTDTPSMTEQARTAFEAAGFAIYQPSSVADAVVEAIIHQRARIVIGKWEKRHVRRSQISPRLVDHELTRLRIGIQRAMRGHHTPNAGNAT
jgi:short-subunit dehydrogenase